VILRMEYKKDDKWDEKEKILKDDQSSPPVGTFVSPSPCSVSQLNVVFSSGIRPHPFKLYFSPCIFPTLGSCYEPLNIIITSVSLMKSIPLPSFMPDSISSVDSQYNLCSKPPKGEYFMEWGGYVASCLSLVLVNPESENPNSQSHN
jgi:hypothetical protein